MSGCSTWPVFTSASILFNPSPAYVFASEFGPNEPSGLVLSLTVTMDTGVDPFGSPRQIRSAITTNA
jgi:hypothetical protein